MHILAADQTFYEGPCVSLTITTTDGERGILANHSSMIAAVKPGTRDSWDLPSFIFRYPCSLPAGGSEPGP